MKGENVLRLMEELDDLFATLDRTEIERSIPHDLRVRLRGVREQYDAVNLEMEVRP